MDSLPNFLTHGAPLCARFAHARSSAINYFCCLSMNNLLREKKWKRTLVCTGVLDSVDALVLRVEFLGNKLTKSSTVFLFALKAISFLRCSCVHNLLTYSGYSPGTYDGASCFSFDFLYLINCCFCCNCDFDCLLCLFVRRENERSAAVASTG